MITLLKLSENYDAMLGSDGILFIHLGHCLTYGKVSYCTDVAVASRPDYVLLVLGNVDSVCYLCHVADYDYSKDPRSVNQLNPHFGECSPAKFKDTPRKTWFLFDSMQRIPTSFAGQLSSRHSKNLIDAFIKSRANHKTLL